MYIETLLGAVPKNFVFKRNILCQSQMAAEVAGTIGMLARCGGKYTFRLYLLAESKGDKMSSQSVSALREKYT
ncbi:hypothetical protein Pelo_1958 [Pelomyxa schiedti]|nr:hypothetical protein Pelo_1958 [Pelomyxa schiedti]